MFGRFARLIKPGILLNYVFLTKWFTQTHFSQQPSSAQQKSNFQNLKSIKSAKNIIKKELCSSKQIQEGKVYKFTLVDGTGNPYPIIVIRKAQKLYALSAINTFKDPLNPLIQYSLQNGVLFNNKIMCPHTGSAFNIQTGTVQYGPASENLPRFFIEQKNGIISVFYPSLIPKKILPKTQPHAQDDLRKVIIVGGDDYAVVGAIDSLTQYGYTGNISIISKETNYPYRKDYLHRYIPNLKRQLGINSKSLTINEFLNYSKEIQNILENKFYNKLKFRPDQWYLEHGIQFLFTEESFRLISKRFYPYLSFSNGLKLEYDGLLVAPQRVPVYPNILNIDQYSKLPVNIFAPYMDKEQHCNLVKFLNLYEVKSILVFGFNHESLQFCTALKQSFPSLQIKVLDKNPRTKLQQQFGQQIQQSILKEYINKNIEFYFQIKNIESSSNSLAKSLKSPKIQINESIRLFLGHQQIIADCAILFPNNYIGNMDGIHQGKYTDIDYTKLNKIIVDPFLRSDSKRIFGSGNCSSMQFFFTRSRYQGNNSLVSYQQGFTAGLNIMALNVPFHYIPFEMHNYLGKKILYAGADKYFDSYLILGSVQEQDFLCLYSCQDQIIAVCASPSRQKDFQIIRESFRLNCTPNLTKITNGEWNIRKIHQLIKHLNKSGCYRDELHNLENKENISDVIWMERTAKGFSNDHPLDQDDQNVQVDSKGYVRQL